MIIRSIWRSRGRNKRHVIRIRFRYVSKECWSVYHKAREEQCHKPRLHHPLMVKLGMVCYGLLLYHIIVSFSEFRLGLVNLVVSLGTFRHTLFFWGGSCFLDFLLNVFVWPWWPWATGVPMKQRSRWPLQQVAQWDRPGGGLCLWWHAPGAGGNRGNVPGWWVIPRIVFVGYNPGDFNGISGGNVHLYLGWTNPLTKWGEPPSKGLVKTWGITPWNFEQFWRTGTWYASQDVCANPCHLRSKSLAEKGEYGRWLYSSLFFSLISDPNWASSHSCNESHHYSFDIAMCSI